jgi:hypothetical protein
MQDDLSEIYFYGNHFRSGFDEFFSPIADGAHFHYISLGKLSRYPLKPFEEAVIAARLISAKLKDPVLCLSGGLDSEAMALAFLAAGISFKAAIMNLDNGTNDYDIAVAKEFCLTNQIPFQEIHIPAAKILEKGEHIAVAEHYRTSSPERALFILFLQQITGEPVVGGEIMRRETNKNEVNFCCPKDRDLSYWRYMSENGIKGVPYFHYYTPELTFSFIAHTRAGYPQNEVIDWAGRHQEFYRHKLNVYKEAGFEVSDISLRTQKWHGFEGLKIKFDVKHGSQNAYINAFREPLENYPVYDTNQILLIDERDDLAHQVLAGKVSL